MSLSPFFGDQTRTVKKAIVKVSPGSFFVLALDVKDCQVGDTWLESSLVVV